MIPSDEVAIVPTLPAVPKSKPEREPILSDPALIGPAKVEVAVVDVAVNVGALAPARNCAVEVAVSVPTVRL